MPIRTLIVMPLFLLSVAAGPVRAQVPAESRVVALARFRAAAESSAARETWSETGAIICGLTGGGIFAAAFYHFSHRDGAVNGTEGTMGGTLVGAAIGATGGALFGSFVGSLFPKHRKLQ